MDSKTKQEVFERVLKSDNGVLKIATSMMGPIEYRLAYFLNYDPNLDKEPLEMAERLEVQVAVRKLIASGNTSFKAFDRLMERLAKEFLKERQTT